jgi:hypothetical protein
MSPKLDLPRLRRSTRSLMDRCGTPRARYRINQKSALEIFHAHMALETQTEEAFVDFTYSIATFP